MYERKPIYIFSRSDNNRSLFIFVSRILKPKQSLALNPRKIYIYIYRHILLTGHIQIIQEQGLLLKKTMASIKALAELVPFKTKHGIRVKIITKWNAATGFFSHKKSMLLGDAKVSYNFLFESKFIYTDYCVKFFFYFLQTGI